MALVTAYKPINMSSLSVWFGTVDTATSTAIIITDYSTKIGIYIGSGITYQNNAVTGGTLNAYGSYTYRYPDYLSDPVYTVTGLSLSAATVYSYVQSNRATQLSILALAGNDAFLGSTGADYLIAYAGNDTLDGGSGNDTLVGSAGDDIYYVDSQSDVVVELSRDNTSTQETFSIGNNNDAIVASVNYVLSESTTGIEDMLAAGLLTGSTINNAINLTGNSLAQGLIGNDANNTLNGKGGDDQLIGAGGNDTLIGEDGIDFFMSGAGDDSMSGGKGNDFFSFNLGESEGTNLVGVRGVMALTGGKDTADGGEGTDTLFMRGSLDNYIISRTSATEYKITVKSGITDVSSAEEITFKNIERLAFGTLATLTSGQADTNTVLLSSISIPSALNDTLTAPNSSDWSINGLAGNDSITGGAGNDTLDGGSGNDTLFGGLGNDFFDFTTLLKASNNVDTIADFRSGDKIRLAKSVMTELQNTSGNLAENAFYVGTSARDLDDRIIYDKKSGKLLYDADGNKAGGVAAVQIALIGSGSMKDLQNTDFIVI